MSGNDDVNTASEVLAENNGTAELLRQIAELTAKVEAYEGERVVRPVFGGEIPRYKLNNPCFLEDDTLHDEGEEIEYIGTPNQDMVPLNDAAKDRMTLYITHLQTCWQEKAKMMGRPGMPMPDMATAIALAMQDARRQPDKVQVVTMPEEKGTVPAMSHLPEAQAQQRRRGRPPKGAAVVSSKAPAPPPKQGPMPVPVLGAAYASDGTSGR